MTVEFELDQIAAYLYDRINESGLIEKVDKLKAEFDLNPFNTDEDEWVGPWQEFRHNVELLVEVGMGAIHFAELITIDGISLNSAQKHEAVCQVLDDALRLPWYAEPFDGPAINMVVTSLVTAMNSMGWIREIIEGDALMTVDAKAVNLEVADVLRKIETEKVHKARRKRAMSAGRFNDTTSDPSQ